MNQIHDSMTIAISCKHIYLIRSVLSSSRLHAAYQLISSGPSKLATLFQSLGYSNCLPDFFYPVAETWRRVWGMDKIFADQDFWMTFFSDKNFHFHGKNFWWFVFLVIDQVFRIFPFFYLIFRILTMLNVVYDPFFTRKTPFLTLFVLSRASDNTTSQNIGGRMHGPSPHLKFLGDRPP